MRIAITLLSLCAGLAIYLPVPVAAKDAQYRVYFGTYTGPKSKGIYMSRWDARAGKLEPVTLAGEVERPSWVTLHPNEKFLYAVSEIGSGGGGAAGMVSAFAIDPASGGLQLLNNVPSGGGGPCHLVVDKAGRTIFVANYGTGSVAGFRLEPDGKLGERTAFIQFSGSSSDPRRQKGPHAHAVVLSPDERFLFVPDLGTDRIMSFRFDSSNGSLVANDPPFGTVQPGSGPRHFTFAPKGKFAYVINEMGSRVTAFSYNAAAGSLTEIQTISTLPEDFKGEDNSAEIEVDRKGRFLYASNRGDDSIAVFSINPKKGTLTKVQRVPTQGKIPRNFQIDPTGKYLLAANQNTDNLAVFKIGSGTGKLTPTGQVLEVPAAICIQFRPR